jgi:hypothetical protein
MCSKPPNTAMNPSNGLKHWGFLKGPRDAAGRRPFCLVSFLARGLSR